MRIELLGTSGCHLCEQAENWLYHCIESEASGQLRSRVAILLVDIADDPALMEQYATTIPVLRVPSGQVWNWPFPATSELQKSLLALIC